MGGKRIAAVAAADVFAAAVAAEVAESTAFAEFDPAAVAAAAVEAALGRSLGIHPSLPFASLFASLGKGLWERSR